MDAEQPLDRDAIRARIKRVEGIGTLSLGAREVAALLDLLEQTERERDDARTEWGDAIDKAAAKRDKAIGERDVARQERDDARTDLGWAHIEASRLRDDVARLTEERDKLRAMFVASEVRAEAAEARVLQLQTALTAISEAWDEFISEDGDDMDVPARAIGAAREVLAAVPVVPDPLQYVPRGQESLAAQPISYTDKDE